MENRFKLLVVDSSTYESHIGEECSDLKEVSIAPKRNELESYKLFFLGMIRSIWKEISQQIEIVTDTESCLYESLFKDIQDQMVEKENIVFTIINKKKEE